MRKAGVCPPFLFYNGNKWHGFLRYFCLVVVTGRTPTTCFPAVPRCYADVVPLLRKKGVQPATERATRCRDLPPERREKRLIDLLPPISVFIFCFLPSISSSYLLFQLLTSIFFLLSSPSCLLTSVFQLPSSIFFLLSFSFRIYPIFRCAFSSPFNTIERSTATSYPACVSTGSSTRRNTSRKVASASSNRRRCSRAYAFRCSP